MSDPERLPSSALTDPTLQMPEIVPGDGGLAWLRSHVPRFTDGERHAELRASCRAVIERLEAMDDDAVRASAATPTVTMLHGLGLSAELAGDVAVAAAAYQPHAPQSPEADAAADRLVAASGGRTDDAATTVCLLRLADPAIRRVIELRRAGSDEPPLRATRRRRPDGSTVEVDLADAPFGAGPHRCPGEALALRLVAAAVDADTPSTSDHKETHDRPA